MGIKKNFVVKNGLEVADDLIFAEEQKVGIGTTAVNYTLDVEGNISLTEGLFVPTSEPGIGTRSGTITVANLNAITGINTVGLLLNDLIFGDNLQVGTAITGIGASILNIFPNHTNGGSLSTTFTFVRYETSGSDGQLLKSRGYNVAPEWVTTEEVFAGVALTAFDVIGGIGSITELEVTGITTLGVTTVFNLEISQDLLVNGVTTSVGGFFGNLTGIATTAINVDGGFADVKRLNVGGTQYISDGTVGMTTINGNTETQLVTIQQSGVGAALFITETSDPFNNCVVVTKLGAVGLGTTNPQYRLDAYDGARFRDGLLVDGQLSAFNLEVQGDAQFDVDANVDGVLTTKNTVVTELLDVTTGISSLGITTIGVGTTSSADALTINQLGTGNALVITDETNPDSTRFIVDGSGKVGIQTSNTNEPLIFDLESRGTTLIGNGLYVKGGNLVSRTGIVSGTDPSSITGIDTTGLNIFDVIDDPGTEINPNTVITAIGVGTVSISPNHNRFGSPIPVTLSVSREFYAGQDGDLLISRGPGQAPNWEPPLEDVQSISTTTTYFPTFVEGSGRVALNITENELAFTPDPGNLGIGSSVPTEKLDVVGNVKVSEDVIVSETVSANNVSVAQTVTANTVDALTYFGDGTALTGIVTQVAAGTGINLSATQTPGKGVVTIDSFFPLGRTIFVTQNGNDNNTGLAENDAKRTIKAAAAVAFANDTIKVYPGTYVENNPVTLSTRVSIEGTELRNCIVTPRNPNRDLFYVDNSCHVTDLSFIGPTMTDGSAVIAFKPLAGVSTDRYFDAARMIRYNLDFIAAEAVGYLTSTDYKNPAFVVPTSPQDCRDDVKDVLKAVMHDITRGGNSKCVGAGKKYYDSEGGLLHITGLDGSGIHSVRQATIDTLDFAVGIAKSVVNNVSWDGNYQTEYYQIKDKSIQADGATGSNEDIGSCANVISAIHTCVGIVTTIVEDIANLGGAGINTSYPANGGTGTTNTVGITSVTYVKETGKTTVTAPGLSVKEGQVVEIRNINFECPSSGSFSITTATYDNATGIITVTAPGINATLGNKVTLNDLQFICPTGIYNVNNALYDNTTGIITVTAPGSNVAIGNSVILRDLEFTCTSGGITTTFYPDGTYGYAFTVLSKSSSDTFTVNVGTSTIPHTYDTGGTVQPILPFPSGANGYDFVVTDAISSDQFSANVGVSTIEHVYYDGGLAYPWSTQAFPSGKLGYEFNVTDVNDDGSFVAFTGISTITHDYVDGGIVVDRSIGVTDADYDNTTGILTVTAPGTYAKVGDYVRLHDVEFTCGSGGITTTFFPDGTQGYEYRVSDVISPGVFSVNVGTSTIPHTYDTGGLVFPYYSTGVKPITQGPYVRNCTNFIPDSIGMRIDGFTAEPADNDDIGVTGSMSVDSYTQFNQGGIGVSITNGAYAQLVSIFTICDEIAIFTASGGQCDLTNSNSSFGNKGLVSDGVGDRNTSSIYRYTGTASTDALIEQDTIVIEDLGQQRPYDGQSIYFGELYYEIESVTITDGGSGYTLPPIGTIDAPTGPDGINAEVSPNIVDGKVVSVNVISSGSQYRPSDNPQITFAGPTGAGTTATGTLNFKPLYYTLESATAPVAGVSTVVLNSNLNNTVSAGTTVYFDRLSLQITSSHSFEWVGSGNDINFAKPALGGVVIEENEVVKLNGGEVIYTSTDQKGNFKIGDDVRINQLTGTISGRAFSQSLLNTVTPIIIALG